MSCAAVECSGKCYQLSRYQSNRRRGDNFSGAEGEEVGHVSQHIDDRCEENADESCSGQVSRVATMQMRIY